MTSSSKISREVYEDEGIYKDSVGNIRESCSIKNIGVIGAETDVTQLWKENSALCSRTIPFDKK